MSRTFESVPAVRTRVPLLLGLIGPSSSGKTFSALRLARGIQRVVGGEIHVIDTEARRARSYAKSAKRPDLFEFKHVNFEPPFGPIDYLDAIEHCIREGAKVIVIDSMTHEHSGPGGVMDQSDRLLDKWCGADEKARQRKLMMSLIRPKRDRKKLNSEIVRLGVNALFCYRAYDKIKPKKGEEPEKLGWQPETTSPLFYEMTARFLLPPGSEGVPKLTSDIDAERSIINLPDQFRDWFTTGTVLSEEVGENMARWAAGDDEKPTDLFDRVSIAIKLCKAPGELEGMLPELRKIPIDKSLPPAEYKSLQALYARRAKELAQAAADAALPSDPDDPGDGPPADYSSEEPAAQ